MRLAPLALLILLAGCGGSHAAASTVLRDGDVEVGEVKPLSAFRLAGVWSYTGLVSPALPTGHRGRGRLFFLEPYDARRIPVVFIYGMTGTPTQFEALVAALDHTRFQPWVFHYRSGDRLGASAGQLWRALAVARRRFGVSRVVLVAHSMGGLVTRQALNLWMTDTASGGAPEIPCVVTLASPLGGHPSAAPGAAAPAGVPAWTDLAPGSAFLQNLYAHPLPDSVAYFLVTATGQDGTTDGVVPVAYQRAPGALREAGQQSAFPTSHVGILSDPEALRAVRSFLDKCAGT